MGFFHDAISGSLADSRYSCHLSVHSGVHTQYFQSSLFTSYFILRIWSCCYCASYTCCLQVIIQCGGQHASYWILLHSSSHHSSSWVHSLSCATSFRYHVTIIEEISECLSQWIRYLSLCQLLTLPAANVRNILQQQLPFHSLALMRNTENIISLCLLWGYCNKSHNW